MSISPIAKAIATGTLVLALAGPVAADDDTGGWWPHWGMGRMMHGWGPGPMAGSGAVTDRIDGRLAFIKAELKITDAQKEAWGEFAETIRNTSDTHFSMMRSMMEDMHSGAFFKKPLPERITIHLTVMEARVEEMKGMAAAVDKLYAVLDDTQKKLADETVPMMGMGPGMGMGAGMGMGWGRGMGPGMMRQ